MKNADTAARISQIAAELEALKATLEKPIPTVAVPRIARGTADVTRAAVMARLDGALDTPPAKRLPTLPEKIEAALRERPRTAMELSSAIGATPKRVSNTMRDLRDRIYNAGSETHPLWAWIIGDETTAAELAAQVRTLVALRPFTLQELITATGARRNRISGVLVRLVEANAVENHGAPNLARWYAPPRKG